MKYNYTMWVYDPTGQRVTFTAEQEADQYDAEMLAQEWATQGGLEVDWIEVIHTTDPNGIIETGNW